jgi:hypothetical protein
VRVYCIIDDAPDIEYGTATDPKKVRRGCRGTHVCCPWSRYRLVGGGSFGRPKDYVRGVMHERACRGHGPHELRVHVVMPLLQRKGQTLFVQQFWVKLVFSPVGD